MFAWHSAMLSGSNSMPQQRAVPFLEGGFAEFRLNSGQLALQDRNKEIAATAGGFEKACVDPLHFTFHKAKHFFGQSRWREYLSVICNSLFRFDKVRKK